MNRLIGTTSTPRPDLLLNKVKSFSIKHNSSTIYEDSNDGIINILITDHGSVSGRSVEDGIELNYIGWINSIKDASFNPIDNADQTAEFLLQRFNSLGTQFLNDVEGSYAIVVCDRRNRRVVIARDTSGGQRIFFRDEPGKLEFLSHLIDSNFFSEKAPTIDRSIETFLLAYEFIPGNKTLYQGYTVLNPGSILDWNNGKKDYSNIKHSTPKNSLPQISELEQAINYIEDCMLSSIRQQIPSHGKIGVLLGGFDSALIVSILKSIGREVETFTFQYSDDSYNQPYVTELSSTLGVKHHWIPINEESILSGIKNYGNVFNQPVSQAHYLINSLTASNIVRECGITYCLTGDGCDDLFLGYPTVYQRARFIMLLTKLSWALWPLDWIFRIGALERKIGHPYRLSRNVVRIIKRKIPSKAFISACSIDNFSFRQLTSESMPNAAFDSEQTLNELASQHKSQSPIRLAYLGKRQVGLNRTKIEGCSSWSGIVINSPYLHPDMKILAELLPEEFSRPDNIRHGGKDGKFALAQMAKIKKYLPEYIISQKKMSPVTTPVDAWYMGKLECSLKKHLDNLPFKTNKNYINSLFKEKMAEKIFRRKIGISRYTSNALSMLLTYACYNSGFNDETE